MTKIEQAIYAMLTESTGKALCDSGGAYGRHWERNQKLSIDDFKAKPAATMEFYRHKDGDVETSVTVDIFHKLTQTLYLDTYCDEFNAMPVDDWDGDGYGLSTAGQEYLEANDFTIGNSWNTYNWDNNFSQVLQGANVERDGETYVLLQIHQGCDVRGGYTDSRLFLVGDEYDVFRDDCGFGVQDPNVDDKTIDMLTGQTHDSYLTLDWMGEWITAGTILH